MNQAKALQSRAQAFAGLTQAPLDLLIIGGGIVGSGIARDASMRGLRTALVEQHDFAFGTSSRSSRLLHGGLRYLAQGRLGLVREGSVEKRILHHIAPHLAEPLPFIFPGYARNRHWVLWQLKIGVKIYDLLCGGQNLGRSTWLSRSKTLQKVPGLSEANLKGAVRYYDGFTSDARLVLDTLRSAARHGATLLNYCHLKDASPGDFWQATLQDNIGGSVLNLRTRAIVNASGPWAQHVPHSRVRLRLTKGIHLVVERSRLPVTETVVMTEQKRILFAIPWGERTILGTTDTDYQGSPEDVRVDAESITYVLRVTNDFFPKAKLTPRDVLSGWAGLRPLIATPSGQPSDISRSHEIRTFEPGWWDVAGGKLTTYRLMAEQTVDRIVKWLNQQQPSSQPASPCRTATEPLLPAADTAGVSGILPPVFSRGLIQHYCSQEWAIHLDDVIIRRTGWHYYFADTAAMANAVANWMAELLDWSEERKQAELAAYGALRLGIAAAVAVEHT